MWLDIFGLSKFAVKSLCSSIEVRDLLLQLFGCNFFIDPYASNLNSEVISSRYTKTIKYLSRHLDESVANEYIQTEVINFDNRNAFRSEFPFNLSCVCFYSSMIMSNSLLESRIKSNT